MTGQPKVRDSSCMTWVGRLAEEERMKRRGVRAMASALRGARARIAWCMVGTAVVQVGRASSIQPKKRRASNPGVHQTEAPVARLAETAATRPWMWKSGIMLRQRSVGESANEAPMWRALAARLDWRSGTI